MDDKYFDEKIKGILESPPEFQPDPSDILAMQQQLRASQPPKRRKIGLLAFLPLLLLPLLFGTGIIYNKFETLNTQVNNLNKQISLLNHKDTIIEKQIIYQHDTIYNVIYREKYIANTEPAENDFQEYNNRVNYIYSLEKRKLFNNSSKMNISRSLGGRGLFLLDQNPSSSFLNLDFLEKNTPIITATHPDDLKHLESLAINPIKNENPNNPALEDKLNNDVPTFEKRKANPIYYFVPTGFRLGGNYGPFVFPQNQAGTSGEVYSISGEIELPKNRSLIIGAEYLNISTKFEDFTNLPNLPSAEPQNPSDQLHEVKGNFSHFQIPITIQQKLFNKKRLQALITTGFVARRPIQQKILYEYIDGGGAEYYANAKANKGSFSLDNFRLGLGCEFSINKKLSSQFLTYYQHAFSQPTDEFSKLRYWNIGFGLNYRI